MPEERLELSRPKTSASKTDVSTNSTIRAKEIRPFKERSLHFVDMFLWNILLFYFNMVGREGFEPPKAKLRELQSLPFDRSGICPEIHFMYLNKNGANYRSWTDDRSLTRRMLYHWAKLAFLFVLSFESRDTILKIKYFASFFLSFFFLR